MQQPGQSRGDDMRKRSATGSSMFPKAMALRKVVVRCTVVLSSVDELILKAPTTASLESRRLFDIEGETTASPLRC
jgi:hypothetical protein